MPTETISWYAASTRGSVLGTGTSFTTPSISLATFYWFDTTYTNCPTATKTEVIATVNPIPAISAIWCN